LELRKKKKKKEEEESKKEEEEDEEVEIEEEEKEEDDVFNREEKIKEEEEGKKKEEERECIVEDKEEIKELDIVDNGDKYMYEYMCVCIGTLHEIDEDIIERDMYVCLNINIYTYISDFYTYKYLSENSQNITHSEMYLINEKIQKK